MTLWTLAERRSNRLDFYSSVETLGQSSVGPIRMQDCYKPRPSHVMKEGRHRGEERWTGRSSLRRFVHLIVYGRCLQRCIVISSASCAVPVAAAAVVLRLCRSPSLPFSITARVGEGGASREYRLLWIDVRRTGTLYCEQRYASVGVAQRHARMPRWLERRIVNPP